MTIKQVLSVLSCAGIVMLWKGRRCGYSSVVKQVALSTNMENVSSVTGSTGQKTQGNFIILPTGQMMRRDSSEIKEQG
jgi:hypothetical protein